MADQVKSPKSIDTRSQQSTADTTVANTWRLSHHYLITYYTVQSIEMPTIVSWASLGYPYIQEYIYTGSRSIIMYIERGREYPTSWLYDAVCHRLV